MIFEDLEISLILKKNHQLNRIQKDNYISSLTVEITFFRVILMFRTKIVFFSINYANYYFSYAPGKRSSTSLQIGLVYIYEIKTCNFE